MKTVHEVCDLAGISVRTLNHYDAIGLLKPTKVSEAGYRLYDEEALERLQTILLFRELQFPLKEIKDILDDPDFDQKQSLGQQIRLLELQRERLDRVIRLAREMIAKGENMMDFSVFDKTEIEQYADEAKERWGKTDTYREYEQNHACKTDEEQNQSVDGLMQCFVQFGTLRTSEPESEIVQRQVKVLSDFISEHYYTCTPQILSGLGQMYVGDERFKANIDRAGGAGTAQLVSRAIEYYCSK